MGTRKPGSVVVAGRQDEAGLTLVELAVSLAVFTVIALSVALTLLRGMEHRQESFQIYVARTALRDIVAEIQELGNLPKNPGNTQGIGALYGQYNGQTRTIPDLPSGQISFTCFADENTVPTELGGPQDLNYDGDALDNLTSAGDDLKLVPMRLRATFQEGSRTHELVLHRLFTRTSN